MTRSTSDWTGILKLVALEVRGQPEVRPGNEWRYGRKGSLVVNVGGERAGTWRDFEAGHGGRVLAFLHHYQGLDKAAALDWLHTRGLLQGSDPGAHERFENRPARNPGPAPLEQAPGLVPDSLKRLRRAQSWWRWSRPIPRSPEHPARRWLADRKLWRPELPLPSPIRWAPATGQQIGAGSIVALSARPAAWEAAWPHLPDVAAVQLIHVDVQGQPALDWFAHDGGQTKRT